MNKADALKEVLEDERENNRYNFKSKVSNLVWKIERKSQELRELKKELTELQFEEVDLPDVSDCL